MLHSKAHPTDVVAALSTGTLYTLGAYAFASLIFTGPLSPYLTHGFNAILISNIVGCLVGSRFSSYPILASLSQSSILTIFALISAGLVSNIAVISNEINPIHTVYTGMVLLTAVIGIFLWILGKCNAGNIVRFIPFPIVAAFLSASGWILVDFSINLIIGTPLINVQWASLSTQTLMQLILSLSIVSSIIILQNWFSRVLVEPIVYIGSIFLYYFGLFISDTSVAQLEKHGWYIEITGANGFSIPLSMISFEKTQWMAFFDWNIAGNILAVIIITPLFFLLILNGIERETQHEFNYNDELKHTGVSNIASSLLGGAAIITAALSGTLRNYQLGAKSRWVGIFMASFFFVVLVFGAFVLKIIPLFIVASLPLMTGVNLLRTWLIRTKQKFLWSDYILLWLVFVTIVSQGFLMGIFMGIISALVLFNYRYSRIDVVRNTLTGSQLHSNNERGLAAEALLMTSRSKIQIIMLQGYLFFGNCNDLIDKLLLQIKVKKESALSFIVLDFKNVQGIDPSSNESFFRLHKHIKEENIKIIFTNLSSLLFESILKYVKLTENDEFFLNLPTLDYGLEWCENQFLMKKTLNWNTYFAGQLHLIFPDEVDLKMFMSYLEPLTVSAGTKIFSGAETLEKIYFLDTGILDVVHIDPNGKKRRIKTVYPGVFVGETSLYLGLNQIFSCEARIASCLYSFPLSNLIKMEKEHPNLAIIFHRYIVCQDLNRLNHTYETILSLV